MKNKRNTENEITSAGKRKMARRITKIRKRWAALIISLFVFGALLIAAVVFSLYMNGNVFGDIGLQSETVYILSVLLCLLPVLLLSIFLVLMFVKNKEKVIKADVVLEGSIAASGTSRTGEEADSRGERFCMLSEIDRNRSKYGNKKYGRGIDLEELCESFRNYAASQLKLYYDIEDIRRFIAGMSVSHILILQGMSGTGKTSLAYAYGSFIGNSSTVIPVQPMWKERTDLVGYYNEFTKRFNETLLLEKMYEANYSKDMYITVLDEMNIARVEYYFAEFLSLLELPNKDERYLDVVSDRCTDLTEYSILILDIPFP